MSRWTQSALSIALPLLAACSARDVTSPPVQLVADGPVGYDTWEEAGVYYSGTTNVTSPFQTGAYVYTNSSVQMDVSTKHQVDHRNQQQL